MSGTNPRPCPQCGRPAAAGADNPWRPFCTERCKLADLGAWFAERYTVPAEPDPDTPEPEPPKPDQARQ